MVLHLRKLIIVTIALIMMVSASPVFSLDGESYAAHNRILNFVAGMMYNGNWGYGDEWGIIGTVRFIAPSEESVESYCGDLAATLEEVKSSRLGNLSTENARVIMGLTSLGYDATDVNGYNLLEPFADFEFVKKPASMGPVWTLMAVNSHNYTIPEAPQGVEQTTREKLVNLILESAVPSGKCWAISGTVPDVDVTCMTIQALAPYYSSNTEVKAAIDKAVAWLSEAQQQSGGYKSYGNENSESSSQVIVALTAVGINPNTDSRFVKNGKSVVDALLAYETKDGGIMHLITDGVANNLATLQGNYALTAYHRFLAGKSALYDMNDIPLKKFDAQPKKRFVPENEEKKEEQAEAKAIPSETTLKLSSALAAGRTFSLGGKTIKLSDSELNEDGQVINESAGEMIYNDNAEDKKPPTVLPWIYGGIAALAALAIVIVLRNRKPE